MRKIAISLSKGGVGKTTTAVNLSAGLALLNYNVLIIDADTQGHSGKSLGVQSDKGLGDVLTENVAPEKAIIQARDNLYILEGGRSLAGAKRFIDKKEFGGENSIAESLKPLEENYDFIILDTAPGLDILGINVLFYADELLSPVSMEVLSLQGLVDYQHTIQSIQKYHHIELKYVLPTFVDGRVKKSKEIKSQLKQYFSKQICDPIRYSVRLSEAPGFGQTIFEYAPKSKGACDYKQLTDRIIGNDSPKNT